MGRLKLYDLNTPQDFLVQERESIYLSKSAEQRFFKTLQLNQLSVAMNNGKPLKTPQGKGIVICKPSI